VTSPARPDGQVVELVQGPADFVRYADQLGLDVERFNHHLRKHAGAQRIAEDVEGADLSGVSGTPTFFINGRRHFGAYDIAALSAAVRAAGARASWRRPGRPSVARPPDSPSPSSAASEPPERRDDG
jgi:glutaredoxin